MRVLPRKVLCQLRDVVQAMSPVNDEGLLRITLLRALDRAITPKRSVLRAHSTKAERAKARRDETFNIRMAVMARADGYCESCGERRELEMDHMFGGFGRRKSLESIWTCWALCGICHRVKTMNSPSASHWLREFVSHCEQLALPGYQDAARIAQARLDALELQGRTNGAQA